MYKKYKDLIPYAIFGVLTTVVNTAVYWVCAHTLKLAVLPSTIIAWFLAVLFAYLTNRRWVFHSEASTRQEIVREVSSFYLCRVATGVLDWACMFVFVDLIHFNDLLVKVAANILVIIINYIASKSVIFRKRNRNT